jgi:hypothetical protein
VIGMVLTNLDLSCSSASSLDASLAGGGVFSATAIRALVPRLRATAAKMIILPSTFIPSSPRAVPRSSSLPSWP